MLRMWSRNISKASRQVMVDSPGCGGGRRGWSSLGSSISAMVLAGCILSPAGGWDGFVVVRFGNVTPASDERFAWPHWDSSRLAFVVSVQQQGGEATVVEGDSARVEGVS
jgi:hypothetical protein